MAKNLSRTFGCPTEFALEVLGGKWKTVILSYLKERPLRYAELRRLIPHLSDKVLTERLRDLIGSGLVVKKTADGKKKTGVYVLTLRGKSLRKPLTELYSWGKTHAGAYGVNVGERLKLLDKDI